MSYTPALGNAADVTWVGAPAYTPPLGNAGDVSWQTGAAPDAVEGAAAATVTTISIDGAALATFGAPVEGSAAGTVATLTVGGAAVAVMGAAGRASGAIPFVSVFSGVIDALHLRYEVRGEVRLGGVLVNRRVRCSKRATGELMGQADTVAGVYCVHAGFDEAEVYVTAIDLAESATDWIPPAANRLVPVLASDTA